MKKAFTWKVNVICGLFIRPLGDFNVFYVKILPSPLIKPAIYKPSCILESGD